MKIEAEADAVAVRLPLTAPAGKTRVKRPRADAESAAVACRAAPMRDGDYLEWQISYYTDNAADAAAVPGVTLRKNGKEFYGCEFIRLLAEARRMGVLPRRRLDEALALAAVPPAGGFAEEEPAARAAAPRPGALLASGFHRFELRVPAYLKSAARHAVEIKIARRQRAVGNQAMVFVHLPLAHCRPLDGRAPFAGRIAEAKELAEYRIGADNVGLLSDVAAAFLFASAQHREDLRALLAQLQ